MKVRFYRGPMDGKRKEIPDNMEYIQFASFQSPTNYVAGAGPWEVEGSPICYRRTQHTHPDGSVFFEWDQPRGTKTGIKRPKRRKPYPDNYGPGWGPYDRKRF